MTDLARISQALHDQYAVQREIGRGGMATVFLARDLKHDRDVALKVLQPELGAVVGVERFLAEIKVTAALQHPNILPLFDSGSAAGLLYYVMPFVRGETLRDRLARERALPVDEAVAIARGIANALDHAHRQGVIHRDIKPANVLLSDGVPMVADFGIARALSAAGGTRVTQAGMAIGTPTYMSPEQAMGEELDPRTDVYALGCVLYEMLAGEAPFAGPTAAALVSQHLASPVPRVRNLRTTVPPVVDDVIARALAKQRDERFATAAELAAALLTPPPVEPMPDYSMVEEPVTRNTEPLAGRRKEFAELLARLDLLAEGRGSMVLVGGEPGVGKTKLTEALLLEARARGYFCLVGHSYEMEGAPPYLPFVEHLEYATRTVPPGRLRAVLGAAAAEISRIMPRLRQLYPDIPEPLDLPPDQQRHYLFTQMCEYLERASRNVSLVMLLDDLHWADESTLLLLEQIAVHLPRMRILVLGTYRDVELEVSRPFARSLERLTRQRLAHRIALRRMPRSDVAELLAQLGAPDPPPALVRAIYDETEGNPFFVEEVFRHLQEEGKLLDAGGNWLPDLRIETLEVPEGVKLVIGRRLERVSEGCRAVLTAAAVIGPRFELSVLEALGELDGDAILDALEEGERAGLVIAQQVKREPQYMFAHELIRQTLVGALSVPRRLRRHLRTAEAMERIYAGKEAQHASELAWHFFQSGAATEEEKTTGYMLLAGRQALAAGAFDEALAQAERAFSVMETPDDRRRADLLWLRASALRGLGRWKEATDPYVEAFDLLVSLDAGDDLLAMTCMFAEMLYFSASEHARGLAIIDRALDATPDVPSVNRARLLALSAAVQASDGAFVEGKARSDRSLEIAKALGDNEALGTVLSERASLLVITGNVSEAVACAAEAYALLQRSTRRWEALFAGSRVVNAKRLAGQPHEVLALVRDLFPEAKAVGHRGAALALVVGRVGSSWILEPHVNILEAAAVECQRDYSDLGTWRELGVLFGAWAAFERGDDRAAGVMAGSAERYGEWFWKDFFWSMAFFFAANGDASLARNILSVRLTPNPRRGDAVPIGTRVGLLTRIHGLTRLGENERAAVLYPLCVESMELGLVLANAPLFEEAAGRAAAAGREWETAERHFANALRVAHTMPHVPGQADVRFAHAEMLLTRGAPGDAERARTMLREAAPMFERAGRTRWQRECRKLLSELADA